MKIQRQTVLRDLGGWNPAQTHGKEIIMIEQDNIRIAQQAYPITAVFICAPASQT
jgi:hypothetical protein